MRHRGRVARQRTAVTVVTANDETTRTKPITPVEMRLSSRRLWAWDAAWNRPGWFGRMNSMEP